MALLSLVFQLCQFLRVLLSWNVARFVELTWTEAVTLWGQSYAVRLR